MSVNKVIFNGRTIMDISDSNFNPDQLPNGNVVYNAAGERIVGHAIVHDVYTDTTANWSLRTTYVPGDGDVIIYTDRSIIEKDGKTIKVPGIKIGDGNAYVVDLPFTDMELDQRLDDHIANMDIHVTPLEKMFWNNKLNFSLNGENLIFNRS